MSEPFNMDAPPGKAMPNPTPEMLDGDVLFEAIWGAIKTWDVNVPESYGGYCGANGSHVTLIYNAIKEVMSDDLAPTPTPVLTVYADDSKLVLTITHDGRLVPGPGLSTDEVTQQTAEMLVRHFEEEIRRCREAGEGSSTRDEGL